MFYFCSCLCGLVGGCVDPMQRVPGVMQWTHGPITKIYQRRTQPRRERTSQGTVLRHLKIHAIASNFSVARRDASTSYRHETRAGTHPLCF